MPDSSRWEKSIDNKYRYASDEAAPEDILFNDIIFRTEKAGDRELFKISLPFFELKDMELSQKGDELTLVIKNERRKFTLPNKLKNKEIQSAKYEDGVLKLIF